MVALQHVHFLLTYRFDWNKCFAHFQKRTIATVIFHSKLSPKIVARKRETSRGAKRWQTNIYVSSISLILALKIYKIHHFLFTKILCQNCNRLCFVCAQVVIQNCCSHCVCVNGVFHELSALFSQPFICDTKIDLRMFACVPSSAFSVEFLFNFQEFCFSYASGY